MNDQTACRAWQSLRVAEAKVRWKHQWKELYEEVIDSGLSTM